MNTNIFVVPDEFLLPAATEVMPSTTFPTILSSCSSKILATLSSRTRHKGSNVPVHHFNDEAVRLVPPWNAVELLDGRHDTGAGYFSNLRPLLSTCKIRLNGG